MFVLSLQRWGCRLFQATQSSESLRQMRMNIGKFLSGVLREHSFHSGGRRVSSPYQIKARPNN